MDSACCTNDASGQQEQGQSEEQAGVNNRTNDVSGQQEQGQSEEQNGVIKFILKWLTGVNKFIRKWEAFSPPKAEEWETIYRPMAQAIIIHVLAAFLFLIYRGPSFEEKPKFNRGNLLPILILLLAAAASLPPAIVALLFPNNMRNIERCQQVRFSFLCLLTGIILSLSTSIFLMATV